MNYRFFLAIFLLLLNNCVKDISILEDNIIINKKAFTNKGFALIYSEELYNNKIIEKKIDQRSLLIFQKNLKKNTTVKITNILNNKIIIAKVGKKSNYPNFNNSVISKRVSKELDLNPEEPYIEILEILENSMFIANKAKTFDEEKNVADKAPVEAISISNLKSNKKKTDNRKVVKFDYLIKVADFYFEKTAKSMKKRIINETKIRNVKIKKINSTQYRVFLGPYTNINSLQKDFNDINILQFENIEILKNNEKNS